MKNRAEARILFSPATNRAAKANHVRQIYLISFHSSIWRILEYMSRVSLYSLISLARPQNGYQQTAVSLLDESRQQEMAVLFVHLQMRHLIQS